MNTRRLRTYGEELVFILAGSPKDLRIRAAAVLPLLTDTITTLFLLFSSGLPVAEFNPLGEYLLQHAFLGTTLFMSVPLFTVLLLFYLPGILGDAFAMTNLLVHTFATVINLVHGSGIPLAALLAVTAYEAYVFILILSPLFSLLWYLPRLRDQAAAFQSGE